MIFIRIDPEFKLFINKKLIRNALKATFISKQLSLSKNALTVWITNDVKIRDLNLKFRNIDRVTDVLSFPADEIDLETGKRYLGDIVISYPQLIRQTSRYSKNSETELSLLCVHGALHLLGYDHDTYKNKKRMWTFQSEILNSLGYTQID